MMRKVFAVTAALSLLCLGLAAQAAPVQWSVSAGGNGHYYEAVLVAGGVSWGDAKAGAEGAGGYLACIGSEEENVFVYGLITDPVFWVEDDPINHHTVGPWLGGFQPSDSSEPGGGWSWVSGEPFTYANWQPFEPNNAPPNNEDAIHFRACSGEGTSPKWNDTWSGSLWPAGYVVEIVPEPSGLLTMMLGLSGLAGLAKLRRK